MHRDVKVEWSNVEILRKERNLREKFLKVYTYKNLDCVMNERNEVMTLRDYR